MQLVLVSLVVLGKPSSWASGHRRGKMLQKSVARCQILGWGRRTL